MLIHNDGVLRFLPLAMSFAMVCSLRWSACWASRPPTPVPLPPHGGVRPPDVHVGVSAGSMVMPPRIGDDFVNWRPPTGGGSTLGVVDFSIFPHLGHELMPRSAPSRRRSVDGRLSRITQWRLACEVAGGRRPGASATRGGIRAIACKNFF